jgi:hypothetical protein
MIDYIRHLVEPAAPWKFAIDVAAAMFAFVAAFFWLRASLVKTPTELRHVVHFPLEGPIEGDIATLMRAVGKQSHLNTWAAGLSAVAALLSGVSIFIGSRWG